MLFHCVCIQYDCCIGVLILDMIVAVVSLSVVVSVEHASSPYQFQFCLFIVTWWN